MFAVEATLPGIVATRMAGIPGDVDAERGPPLAIPLRHFLVALGFLLAGVAVGVGSGAGILRSTRVVHVHLLLAGFVCVTIAGAMTQFVPVWSGVALHSRRLARAQLWLLAVGLSGFVTALLAGAPTLAPPFGALLFAGFWTLAYNVGRTLWAARPLDPTERHFAVALAFFLGVTTLGLTLAVDLVTPLLGDGMSRPNVRAAHATLAVFGAVLTTVFGALYQLVPMFGQTDLDGHDRRLRRVETWGYPGGVATLAAGRLLGSAPVARVGGALVLAGTAAFGVVLVRRLLDARGDRTPMLTRYLVLAVGLWVWLAVTLPTWLRSPLAAPTFGPPATGHLLGLLLVLVVAGTLYHVVPFLVWVDRYADRLGLADVPMIDDLYDDRLAATDFWLVTGGGALLVGGEWVGLPVLSLGGGLATALGLTVFACNLGLVVRRHAPGTVWGGRSPSGGEG